MKKKLNIIWLLSFLFWSCQNNELTLEQAFPLIAAYYGFSISNMEKDSSSEKTSEAMLQTMIAIDQKIDDYGWPPQKYEILQKNGIIDVYYEERGFLGGIYVASVAKQGEKYFSNIRTWNSSTQGQISQLVFKGYKVKINNINISSNANDKSAIAEVHFSIYDISPIQSIVSPLKISNFKSMVSFKLFANGWQIIDEEKSHIKINRIDNPLHWAEG